MKKIVLLLILATYIFAKGLTPNLLINEESPYLLQHAYNPVSWYPWNKKAFDLAKKQNKLIFVSIGYSTCHWCHVMNKESFENKKIAKLLNKDYISIKIDKEQLPHIDSSYQEKLTKLKSRRNGWPLNFILTAQKDLVYISTYIPSYFNYGVEGMNTLLPRIAKEYKNKDKKLITQIKNYKNIINSEDSFIPSKTLKLDTEFIRLMKNRYDKIYSGFDRQPKFPLPSHLNLLYTLSLIKQNSLKKEASKMFEKSLTAIAKAGINDHIEGGFYRYSVYADWIIPHFEKMLYTQAELIPQFYNTYIKTNNPLFKKTIINTADFVNIYLRNDENLFYSAIDADSINEKNEKEEGFYYTYKYDEIDKILKQRDIKNSEEILEYLGFEDFGNFENELNNVYINTQIEKPKNTDKAINILKELRKKRVFPFVDKKIISSWNALMIKALFISSNIDEKYLQQAKLSLDSLLKNLYINETLYHLKFDAKNPKQKALLEDYAFLIDCLITAHQRTFDKKYLTLAKKLSNIALKKFYKENKWYLDESNEYEGGFKDKYYASAVSVMLNNLLSISLLTYDLKLLEKTKEMIKNQRNKILKNIDKHPLALKALLRLQTEDIIIKSNKKNLEENKDKIKRINYPFILQQKEETNMFLACDKDSCFEYSKELNEVIKTIEK